MQTNLAELLEIVRSTTARRMRLTVDPRSGQVRLVIPHRAAVAPALHWAEQHRGWIAAQQAKLPDPWPIVPGMIVPLAGQDLWLEWEERFPRGPKADATAIRVGGPRDMLEGRLLRWLRKEALRVLTDDTRYYAEKAGVTLGKIGVGDPRSRWGSCAVNGDIRYSWRLILAPTDVRRATVAHEVAHRVHMNHSRAFHAEVARIYEKSPAAARGWLRHHGARLHWFGRGSDSSGLMASSMNF
jgi:predicted metal-dependent hydrolase